MSEKWLVHVTTEGTGAHEECNIFYTSVYVYDTKDTAVAAARKAMPGGKEEHYGQTVRFTDRRDNFLLVVPAADGDIELQLDEDFDDEDDEDDTSPPVAINCCRFGDIA